LRPINALVMCVALLLAACAPHKSAPKAENFPVVVPFAIDRAGSKVTVEFELPNAIDPHLSEPTLRPVFIGIRWTFRDGDLMTEEESKAWDQHRNYMKLESVPTRLRLWRSEQGRWEPVVLQEMHDNFRHGQGRFWYEPISGNGIATSLRPGGTDNDELMAIGRYDQNENKAYVSYELVQITPPTPGRYRLEAESLKDHAVIHGLAFELLVSHYYHYGVLSPL
jgi:hypothetical protein